MEKRSFGCHNAKVLLHTVYFYNGKLFGIRAKEHRDLRYNNFRVDSNSITFDESSLKTYHGGLRGLKYSARVIKHICCPSDEPNHFPCLVEAHGKYLECVKFFAVKTNAFYFRPNRDSAKFCYDNAPVGINLFNKILSNELCGEAGLTRKTSQSESKLCKYVIPQLSRREIN